MLVEAPPTSPSPSERELYRAALRELVKTDTVEGTLAYGELVYGHLPAPHHEELIEAAHYAVQTGEDTMILEPAGAAKSTWGNKIFLAHKISLNPDIRIGLFSQTSTFAARFSAAIMKTFEENDEHRYLFGDIAFGSKWTDLEWIRKGSSVAQTNNLTVFGGGTGGQVASKRFDIILADDILGKENTETVDQRTKVKEWFDQVLYPRLVANGVFIGYGTRWAPGDLYETFISPIVPVDDSHEAGYGFRSLIKQALITPNVDDQSTWSSYWEEVWPLADLLKRRARDRGMFDATYQNDVEGLLQGDLWQRSYYQYFGKPDGDPDEDLREFRRDILSRRVGVDLAFSTRERADFTTAVETAEGMEGDFFVLRERRTKIDVGHPEFIVHAYEMGPGISLVVVESIQAQSAIVKQVMRDYPMVPIVGHPTDTDKRTRASAVAEKYKARKVWHHASLKYGYLEREQMGFPKGHDDLIDAEAMSMQLGGSSFFFGKVDVRR